MPRADAIARIEFTLPALSAEPVQVPAEIAAAWVRDIPDEGAETRAAINEGLAQAERGDFASTVDVEAALGRPWK